MVGGLSEEEPADQKLQDLCDSVKADFLALSGKNTGTFVAVSSRSQVVAGMNYFVKIQVGVEEEEEYCILRIYKPLPHTGKKPSLVNYECGKTRTDTIEYI
ncbi:cystatin-B-like isoform 1-T2 [Leptodactylus fuscus]|uniref:cystatin-B-like n=1 Tax=Leptodactylus fuscus TaxID=238119 RepID=UPI003F4E5CC3